MIRAAFAAVVLGWRRAVRKWRQWLGAACGLALCLALFGTLAASGVVAGDHALTDRFDRASPAQRTISLSWNGGAGADTDARARSTLRATGAGEPARGMLTVPGAFGNRILRLAGAEGLDTAVRLVAGRLPQGCEPRRCEVLYVAGSPPPARITARGMTLAVVGKGVLTHARAIGFATKPSDLGGPTTARRPTLLVSSRPAELDRLASISSLSRTNHWHAQLARGTVHLWNVAEIQARLARVVQRLQRASNEFAVTTPQVPLSAARAAAEKARPRLDAVAALVVAALVCFLILASGAMRTGVLAEDGRLARVGASAWQRLVVLAAETSVPVLAGAAMGSALAVAGGFLRADAGGVPREHAWAAVADGLSGAGLALIAVGWLVLALSVRLAPQAARSLLATLAVAGAAVLVALLTVSDDPGQPLPGAAIPIAAGLACLAVGLALPGLLRLLARPMTQRSPRLGLAVVQMAGSSGPVALAVASLGVCLGLGIFAVAYHATVEEAQRAEAARIVPSAAVIVPGVGFASPIAGRSSAQWKARTGAELVAPVVRQTGSVLAGPTRRSVKVLGVPATMLASGDMWSPAEGDGARSELSRRLVRGDWADPFRDVALPSSGRVHLRAIAGGDSVEVGALLRGSDGQLHKVRLGPTTPGTTALSAALPQQPGGLSLAGLVLTRTTGQLVTATHQAAEGGGGSDAPSVGTLRMVRLRVAGRELELDSWRGHKAAEGGGGDFRFRITGSASGIVRPAAVVDRQPLPVLVDRATAGDARISEGLTLDVGGAQVPAEVVGEVGYFATVSPGERVVVADTAGLLAAVQAASPEAIGPRELWVATGAADEQRVIAGAQRLARGAGLEVRSRRAVLDRLRREPIGREVLGALTAVVILLVVLAVASVALAIRSELRDRAHALVDLEGQGLGPRLLRHGLRTRTAAMVGLGVLVGTGFAAAVSPLLGRAVLAAASSAAASLGVAPEFPVLPLVLLTVGLVAASCLVGLALSATALRSPVPSAEQGETA